MLEIVDIDNPLIDQYKNLKISRNTSSVNATFIVEGRKAVLKLLSSNFRVKSLFAVRDFYDEFFNIIIQKVVPEKQFIATKKLMNNLVGFKLHAGILAEAEIPVNSKFDSISETIVCLNRITDAENVGSIIRNCLAFEFNNIIVDSGCYFPYSRRVARVSMGSLFYQNIHIAGTLSDTIKMLKNIDYKAIAVENNMNSVAMKKKYYNGKKIIIFGNETTGIESEIIDLCDYIVHIPMSNKIESLNVASASAIFLEYIYDLKHGNT